MNTLRRFLAIAVLLLTVLSARTQTRPKAEKIAFVGNSITYGMGVFNREKNSFPSQLQSMLGPECEIGNFGVGGRTLLREGDYPYVETDAYRSALAFEADWVFIMLGSNDVKSTNRDKLGQFESDYHALIDDFRASGARIVLMKPIPSFMDDSTDIWDPIIVQKVIPAIEKVAYDERLEVIDMYQLFVDQPHLVPDKIHPSSIGAGVIARRIYELIVQEDDPDFDLTAKLGLKNATSSFYGFEQTDFEFEGVPAKIVSPRVVREGNPWVWRARFWGHEPQTDIALLERGFHVVYCDVANLFGNEEAVERWNRFYQYLNNAGLSDKVALEGMSRGGLIIYNWAVANPKKVACVYADAPVLNGKSWPGGQLTGTGSKGDWKRFKEVYEIESKQDEQEFVGNPIHKTEAIAKAGFPMFHVCGAADNVVPVSENTTPFEEKVKAAGGDIRVIYKEGVGHHPHSLKNPTRIVDFILRATGAKPNFAAIPAPGSEYRSAAGWTKNKGWWAQHRQIDSLSRASEDIDLMLLGNSITQGWGGDRSYVTYAPGKKATQKHFNDLRWIGAGISGDQAQNVAWRMLDGQYEQANPRYVAITIGVNNFPHHTAEEIAKGIEVDLQIAKDKFPNAEILLFGPLPAGVEADGDYRRKYNKVHELIERLGEQESVSYHNLIDLFTEENGDLNLKLCGSDGIHLHPEGYMVWAKYIREQIR